MVTTTSRSSGGAPAEGCLGAILASAARVELMIASLDALPVDPASRKVVWEARCPTKPVPLRGEILGGHADVVAAREVMRELFAW